MSLPASPWTVAWVLSAAALAGLRKSSRTIFLFLLCLTAYLATFRWRGGDDIPNTLLPFCVLRHGTVSMDPFREWYRVKGLTQDFTVTAGTHLLSVHPIGPGILALPVFAPFVLAGRAPEEELLHNLGKISGSLLCALSAVVVFAAAKRRCSPSWALRVAILYGLGSYAFSVASQALWSHGPALLGVALGVWAAWGPKDDPAEALVGGFGLGLATTCRPDSALFLAGLSLYWLLHRRKTLLPFLVGIAVPLSLTALYWLHYVGRLRPPESHYQGILFGGFQWQAFWAMLLSPTRGLIFFTPAALLGFWGLKRAWNRGERTAPFLLGSIAATWLFFCFRTTWSGGMTFGNRYFAVLVMVATLFCVELEETLSKGTPHRLWAAAFAASVAIHATGAFFTWPGSFDIEPEMASLWRLSLFPPVNLFLSSGALGGLSVPLRIAAGGAFLLAAASAGYATSWLDKHA